MIMAEQKGPHVPRFVATDILHDNVGMDALERAAACDRPGRASRSASLRRNYNDAKGKIFFDPGDLDGARGGMAGKSVLARCGPDTPRRGCRVRVRRPKCDAHTRWRADVRVAYKRPFFSTIFQ